MLLIGFATYLEVSWRSRLKQTIDHYEKRIVAEVDGYYKLGLAEGQVKAGDVR